MGKSNLFVIFLSLQEQRICILHAADAVFSSSNHNDRDFCNVRKVKFKACRLLITLLVLHFLNSDRLLYSFRKHFTQPLAFHLDIVLVNIIDFLLFNTELGFIRKQPRVE